MSKIGSKSEPAGRKPRVSKSDWLGMALDVLEKGGIQAVRVERLAAQLGVAKSGFYYHFRDRDDLFDKMLDHWLSLDGTPLIRERMMADATPLQRLKTISEVVDKADLARYDTAVRQWARQDPKVRRVWRREMDKRLAHIRGIFAALGFEGDDLEMRTRTFVSYQVTERELYHDLSVTDRENLRKRRITFLTRCD